MCVLLWCVLLGLVSCFIWSLAPRPCCFVSALGFWTGLVRHCFLLPAHVFNRGCFHACFTTFCVRSWLWLLLFSFSFPFLFVFVFMFVFVLSAVVLALALGLGLVLILALAFVLCPSSFVLRSSCFALCSLFFVLGSSFFPLRFSFLVLRSSFYVLCSLLSVLPSCFLLLLLLLVLLLLLLLLLLLHLLSLILFLLLLSFLLWVLLFLFFPFVFSFLLSFWMLFYLFAFFALGVWTGLEANKLYLVSKIKFRSRPPGCPVWFLGSGWISWLWLKTGQVQEYTKCVLIAPGGRAGRDCTWQCAELPQSPWITWFGGQGRPSVYK